MRVLITGGHGQLGREAALQWASEGDDVTAVDRDELDVTDRGAVRSAVTSLRPQVVLHTAAYTAVDACETDPGGALALNAVAVRWVAEACDLVGAHLIALSTDYVFDGAKTEPYHEWDAPNPQSVYGRTKRAGELEALALGARAAVVRTSWLCGRYGGNMVATIMRLAGERERLQFVDDQWGHPTFCGDLVVALRHLALERASGVWHLTNQGATSWYGFARAVLQAMGDDPDRVDAVATTDLTPARPAPRPANGVLDNAVARLAGWPTMREFTEPLTELVTVLRTR
jgi:dTDP-4-dehydrorhamnose reductase